MVLSIDKQIGRARVEQVERVKAKTVFEDMAEMRAQIERQKTIIARQAADITQLNERIEELTGGRKAVVAPDAEGVGLWPTEGRFAPPAQRTFNNRPVVTVKEAAMRARVGLWSAYRYVESGWWESEKAPGGIVVYADQALSPRPRGGSRK